MEKERKPFLASLPKYLTYQPVETVCIGYRLVGKNQPAFVIAEVGSNHRGQIKNALRAIELAVQAGADAVKFQHLTADKIAADTPVSFSWKGKKNFKTFSEFYRPSQMPYQWTLQLAAHARKHKIIFLSTPFDKEAVDVLARAKVPAFKVASYELTDDLLLRYIARKGKPIILSTGMAYLEEVAHAIRTIQEEGNNQIVLLHCVSIYPPPSFADLNLRAITTLQEAFKLPVGYSDHSDPQVLAAPLAAVALGACVIEKHFTDRRTGGSHDDPNSSEPEEFKKMILEIRRAEAALAGSGLKQPITRGRHRLGEDEISDRWVRRSLYAAQDIPKGTIITENMIITLRPVGGIDPRDYQRVIGRKAARTIKARSPITWRDV